MLRKKGRKNLLLRYRNRRTGEEKYRSLDHADYRKAEREASQWERELAEGGAFDPERLTWAEAFDDYLSQHLSSVKPASRMKATRQLVIFAAQQRPGVLADISSAMLARHAEWLRRTPYKRGGTTQPRSETTIDGHLTAIMAFLEWCRGTGRIRDLPTRPTISRSRSKAARMKGRPLTDSEFGKIVAAIPLVVPTFTEQWQRLISGLWLSGLRLGEALALTWDRSSGFSLDFSGKFPMYWIEAESEKGFQDRLLPVAPEFAAMLSTVPESERVGKVFPLSKLRVRGDSWRVDTVSRKISEIGRKAGVVVSRGGKAASAHDFRRSFGLRWAERLMPKDLMTLMRHNDISTTMKYYVGQNADRTAAKLWGTAWGTGENSPPVQSTQASEMQ